MNIDYSLFYIYHDKIKSLFDYSRDITDLNKKQIKNYLLKIFYLNYNAVLDLNIDKLPQFEKIGNLKKYIKSIIYFINGAFVKHYFNLLEISNLLNIGFRLFNDLMNNYLNPILNLKHNRNIFLTNCKYWQLFDLLEV